MTTAVLVGVALAVAGPDLVTVGGAVLAGRRMPRLGWLLTVVVTAHTSLVVAALMRGAA